VQPDLIKLTLKVPGTKRLKLKRVDLLLNFGFKFNLRRYTKTGVLSVRFKFIHSKKVPEGTRLPDRHACFTDVEAVADMVGWCRLTPVETRVERAWFQLLKVKYDI